MYIKQIIIQGFKSYKEQTVIEPFSPKHNVIVGRNGSGKSNFFAAIRFVLSDAYTQMGKEERQALLHEGTGHAVMSAFVEIIFDNSDERFPTGKPELVLRRTIGIKKDEYSLDRKNATKNDVMNLLESAGFSRSNPYYIVPQGRVTALTNMKDAERLLLLKEVAGTQVYEARRAESLKIMTETDNKRAKIDELLAYIRERLAELEEEKEELRDYEEKNKERRCLQYTIDHREQVAIAQELDSIEEQRQTGMDNTDDDRDRFIQGEKELAEIDEDAKKLSQDTDLLRIDKRQLESERKDAARRRAKVELDLNDLNEGLSTAQQSRAAHEKEFKSLQDSITRNEKDLKKLDPDFKKRSDEENRAKAELDKAEALRQRLFSKQGRNARFKTKQERDKWLQEEINGSYLQVSSIKAVRMQTEEEIKELQEHISGGEADITALRGQLDQRGTTSDSAQKQLQEKRGEVEKVHDERGNMWREDAKLDTILTNVESELTKAERTLAHRMDSDTSRGLAAIRRIKRQHNIDGLYGTLGELMKVDPKFAIAVEATAGNSLFHYVVDNDETASKVLEILQKERSGRVTFMPLNRLKPRAMNLPKAADAVPMIEKLEYDPHHHKAFLQVFGKTIICPSLAVASQYARSHSVSAITMDGDRSDKKGALSGGYQDMRQSRLEAIQTVAKWRKEHDAVRQQSSELKKEVEKKNQEVTKAKGELQKLEQAKQRQENSYFPLQQQLQGLTSSLQHRRDDLDAKTRALANIDANMKHLADQQSALEAEKASDFKKALTSEEENQLEALGTTLPSLRKTYSEASSARHEVETRKSTLEIELREHLRPRLDQLNAQAYDDQHGSSSGRIKEVNDELQRVVKAIKGFEARLQQLEKSIEDATAQLAELEHRRGETRQQQEEIARGIEKQQKRTEKGLQKKALLTRQAADVSARIRDLGVLPQDAFARYSRLKSDAAVARLRKVNEALKKYSHVNKKAFQQYEQFTAQRETLSRRREELDSSQASIEELIQVLDQRKDEAIERTFKQVSREFATVFETLVPAGRGRLVIQRKQDRRAADDEDDDEEGRESVENYTGVGISVSFNSKHDEQQRIQQLSGGQKSLCALALVFSIQRCDPAPFYLFDEIDANLDAQYRTAVAQMLHSLCVRADESQATQGNSTQGTTGGGGHAQFICTTFRPEMLRVAEKCYGVRYVGKSSSVAAVTRDEAMDFVQGETRQ